MTPNDIKNRVICQRCQQPMICNPLNISVCTCSKIKLSIKEQQYIANYYTNCVCNTCLLHLKDEFLAQK